jgi:hypothetical protein
VNTLEFLVEKHRIDLDDEPPFLLARTRWDYLPYLFRDLGFAAGAEIGVEEGRFSQFLCQVIPGLKLYAVDAWLSYGWYLTTRYTQEVMDEKHRKAVRNLAPFNCEIVWGMSSEVAGHFADDSLDFVFIDSNGGFEYACQDIGLWSQKVRPGGIVSGHDYFNSRLPGRCRVKDAVDQWIREQKIAAWFVIVGGRYPSWFYVR